MRVLYTISHAYLSVSDVHKINQTENNYGKTN